MKTILFVASILMVFACQPVQENEETKVKQEAVKAKDGVFIHVKSGVDNSHEVLMALSLADKMSETQDVIMYFDIKGIEVVLKDSPDIAYSHFESSHTAIQKLFEKGIIIMACPGCLKAAGKTPEDLMEGIQVANKDNFFNFTEGRILTIDY
jgi:predicted peroxiredoxin